ncbi:MAG TPA: tRNA (N6-threonylcarbamoyladenosine(37)-N6)-methyltransferase TrmO [Thermoplasmata archaeon]|nr:tRNA (N6-threonylcarbamoyladenosine(37)-N6)-methyltransferase TrmO [Thermoplasmata archaeon]
MKLKTIALVKNGVVETPGDWGRVTSKLVFKKEYVEGLYKISHFKHLWVIFGFHKSRITMLKVHPRRDASIPVVGVFASCSPTRPNKLGLTLVKLVSVKRNIVIVRGLDAFDGSPVFNIKPPEDEIDY